MSGLPTNQPGASGYREVLRGVSLFANLTDAQLEELRGCVTRVGYRKGEVVCCENEPGDTLYVIEKGELEIWSPGAPSRVVGRLGPGEFFGEMALLLDQPRTATVTVARPASLLSLDRETFRRLIEDSPKILEVISKALCERLAVTTRGESVEPRTTVVGVFADPDVKGKSLVASTLAALLADLSEGDALLVSCRLDSVGSDAPAGPSLAALARGQAEQLASDVMTAPAGVASLSVDVQPNDGEDTLIGGLTTLTARLGSRFSMLVLDLCDRPFVNVRAMAQACDVLVHVTDRPRALPLTEGGGSVRIYQVVNLYNRESRALPLHQCEPFVVPADVNIVELDPTAQASYLIAHRWSPASPPLRRLARKIMGATVGVAVGGGGAFGIAHLGVLRVLEDNDIPIDLVAGTSMGSIVGLGYAAGMRPAEMYDIARRIGTKRMTLSALDFSIARPGILAGDRIIQIFGPLLGAVETFEDLQLPCRMVAADVESGDRVCIGDGRLEDAVRASCSVPVVWAPVRRGERVLVDGGIVEPVPVDTVREMGADICIAINVVPHLQKGVDTMLSRAYRRLNAINPLAYLGGSRGLPNMFDIVMNSMQTLQHELGNFNAVSADVLINPDLSDFTWIEFYRPAELIERGERAAERALPEIERALARVGSVRRPH